MAGLKGWMQGRVCGGWRGMITCWTLLLFFHHIDTMGVQHSWLMCSVWTSLWDKMSCRQRSVRYETWPDHKGFWVMGPNRKKRYSDFQSQPLYLVWGHQLMEFMVVSEVRWKDHCGPAILEKNSSSIRDCRVCGEFDIFSKAKETKQESSWWICIIKSRRGNRTTDRNSLCTGHVSGWKRQNCGKSWHPCTE